jgi:hypothetical protein
VAARERCPSADGDRPCHRRSAATFDDRNDDMRQRGNELPAISCRVDDSSQGRRSDCDESFEAFQMTQGQKAQGSSIQLQAVAEHSRIIRRRT